MHKDIVDGNERRNKHFYSFCIRPPVTIDGQFKDENIILLVRSHPITFIPWVVSACALLLAPLILNIFIIEFLSVSEILFVNVFWYSGVFSYIFINVLSWLFNVGIVTDHRIIDIDYTNILNKFVTATSLEDVTDVSEKTTGYIRSLFQYGDVQLQTSGIKQDVEFTAVPEPSEVVAVINKLMS